MAKTTRFFIDKRTAYPLALFVLDVHPSASFLPWSGVKKAHRVVRFNTEEIHELLLLPLLLFS